MRRLLGARIKRIDFVPGQIPGEDQISDLRILRLGDYSELVDIEVGDADRPDFARFLQALQRAYGFIFGRILIRKMYIICITKS